MKNVTVKKGELLEKLKANREAHRALFLKAQEGYRKTVIELLDEALQDARNGGPIRLAFSLVEPEDQTDDYDRVIGMLEMSIDETVELGERQFRCFVQDKWDWTSHVLATNVMYAGKL